MDSILNSTKKLLGITPEYEHFDADIIMHINAVFLILNQMGVGPDVPFVITDDTATWDQFSSNIAQIEMVKSYMGNKVKYLFDPPQGGAVMSALEKTIAEQEWRLNVACDPPKTE